MAEINFDHAELSEQDIKFIATFLRFEFALKEEGFCRENGEAKVEWSRVVDTLGSAFYEQIRKAGRARTILGKPPQKQIARDHALDWRTHERPRSTQDLIDAVMRVRNNLLHGGKSGEADFDPAEPHRHTNLIGEAQWIIEQALHQMPDVRARFEGRY